MYLACHQSKPRFWCRLWTAAQSSEVLRLAACLLSLLLQAAAHTHSDTYSSVMHLANTQLCFYCVSITKTWLFLPADPFLSPRTAGPVCSLDHPSPCWPHGGAVSTGWNTPHPDPYRPVPESVGRPRQTPAGRHEHNFYGWTLHMYM